jgi:hypothetical protein
MSLFTILKLETIENAFITGLLLTGSIEQAERAIVSCVHCSEEEDVRGQEVFRRVIQWSVDPQEPQRSRKGIDEASVRILPFELGCVLYLPSHLRHCYVLRILVGLSREICAWLLHTDVHQISQRTQSALNILAEVHNRTGRADLGSSGAREMESSPIDTVDLALLTSAQQKAKLSLGERYLPEEATASKGAVTKRTRPEDQQSTVSFFWDLGTSFG